MFRINSVLGIIQLAITSISSTGSFVKMSKPYNNDKTPEPLLQARQELRKSLLDNDMTTLTTKTSSEAFDKRRLEGDKNTGKNTGKNDHSNIHNNYDNQAQDGDEDLYKRLRIYFETSSLQDTLEKFENDENVKAKLDFLEQTVLPNLEEAWASRLSVIPLDTILIPETVCGINTKIIEVRGVDLVIFVNAQECNFGGELLAYAFPCKMSSIDDRPVIGMIHFCLDAIGLEGGAVPESQTTTSIEVAIHEVAHILGMNSDLFPLFRDENGERYTPIPFKSTSIECIDGTIHDDVIVPSERVLQRRNYIDGSIAHFEIVTPRVKSVVRNQFDCQSITGAQLENQPTNPLDCFGSHWDERLFYTESMGAIYNKEANVLSPLTISMMEDTGWYQGNYTDVKISTFGHGAGCDFVQGECILDDGLLPSYSKGFFCNQKGQISGGELSGGLMCSPDLSHIAYCDLADTSKSTGVSSFSIPDKFRYFPDENLGPVFFNRADYCPVPIGIPDQDCRVEVFDPNFVLNYGEKRGKNSKCFNYRRLGVSLSAEYSGAICYDTKCNTATKTLEVFVNDDVIHCRRDFQEMEIPGYIKASVTCPRLSVACPEFFCPANCAGRGTCDFDSKMCICDETNSVGRGPDCFGDTPSPTSSFAPSTVIDHESSSASSRNDPFVSFLSLWIIFLLYL